MKFINPWYEWIWVGLLLITFLFAGSFAYDCVDSINETSIQKMCEQENNCDELSKYKIMNFCKEEIMNVITWVILVSVIYNIIYIITFIIRKEKGYY